MRWMDKPPLSSFEGVIPSPAQYLPAKLTRGRDGVDGMDGRDGEQGPPGEKGEPGRDGKDGKDGRDGRDGKDGVDGKNGRSGKDGSADGPEEVFEKLLQAKGKLPLSFIEDLERRFEEVLANVRKRRGGDNTMIGGPTQLLIKSNGTGISNVAQINFGSNITVTPTGDGTSVDVNASGGGGSFSVMVPTGTVDGSNRSFVFTSAPQLIALDNGNLMNKVSSDGTVNWTGTTSVTLTQAPNSNIYGV